jgi:hypothetical protein
MPVCKLYLLFISAESANEKEKKSILLAFQCLQPIQCNHFQVIPLHTHIVVKALLAQP